MSITRLRQARQMYAMGQRVAKTMDGSRPGYRGDGGYQGGSGAPGSAESSGGGKGGSGNNNGSGGNGGGNRPNPHTDSGYSTTSTPTKSMLKYYNTCLTAIKQDLKKPGIPRKGVWANLDEVNHETRDLTDDELDDYLTSKYGSMIEDEFPDSADNNIIKFKPKDTMH